MDPQYAQMDPQQQAAYRAYVDTLSPFELARLLREVSQRAKADPGDAALAARLAILRARAQVVAQQDRQDRQPSDQHHQHD